MTDWTWPGAALHGENEAFLKAIAASPHEDAPRLVYADWLEERDDPRGEYLRLVLHLETLLARMGELGSRIDPEWVAAAAGRIPVLVRRTERIRAFEVRRCMVIIGRDGRLSQVIDREVPFPRGPRHAFMFHLRDLEHDTVTVVRYRPSEEVQVVRFLSGFSWDDEADGRRNS